LNDLLKVFVGLRLARARISQESPFTDDLLLGQVGPHGTGPRNQPQADVIWSPREGWVAPARCSGQTNRRVDERAREGLHAHNRLSRTYDLNPKNRGRRDPALPRAYALRAVRA